MKVPPSGRVPEQGPDWVLVAIEACGSRTPDLFCSPIVLGYMDVYIGGRNTSGEPRGAHEGGGRAQGGGRTPCLVASSLLPLRGLQVSQVAFLPKISSEKFHVNWTPFDFPFLRNPKIGKKTETGTEIGRASCRERV